MNTKPKADWSELDPDTLPSDLRAKYDAYKAQYRAMKAARLDFEESMNANVPEGDRMIFGYNFGKLSVAIVPDDAKPKAKAKAPLSLATYLAQRAQAGLN